VDKETFLSKVQELGQLETAEEMRAGLAELQNGVTEVFDANANLTNQHEADTKEMEAIRQANMKLFTQLGTDTTPAKQVEEQTGLKQETVERRKFENLYDNKGNFIKH
jgi:hypothetical protein